MKPDISTDFPIQEHIARRWSGRSFRDEKISDEVLGSIFEAARWAPSCMNEQPWHFTIAHSGSEMYNRLFDTLSEGNKLWCHAAPVIVAAGVRDYLSDGVSLNSYAEHDLGIALGHIGIQATAEDVNMHQLGGFDASQAQLALGYDRKDIRVKTLFVLGYRGDGKELNEPFKSRETAKQMRKPLSEIVKVHQ